MSSRHETMSAEEFRAALDYLGLSQGEAADVLRVASRQRISHWCNGHLPVPSYIAGAV
jgi:DNA-binding transcriptional regulator YiaG